MKKISYITIFFTMVFFSVAVAAEKQIVSVNTDQSNTEVGEIITLSVLYDVTDAQKQLSSLGVRIHYDSSILEYKGANNEFKINQLGLPQDSAEIVDKDVDDKNKGTDRFILLTWADVLFTSWPGENVTLPLKLIDLQFKVLKDQSTNINVTQKTGDSAYGFKGVGLKLN